MVAGAAAAMATPPLRVPRGAEGGGAQEAPHWDYVKAAWLRL